MKDGGLVLLTGRILEMRGRDTVRISKVKERHRGTTHKPHTQTPPKRREGEKTAPPTRAEGEQHDAKGGGRLVLYNLFATFRVARLTSQTRKLRLVGVATDRYL